MTGHAEGKTRETLLDILGTLRTFMSAEYVDSVSDVGDHHRRLTEKYETLVGAILDGYLSDCLDILIRDFIDYLGNHFSVEETIMTLVEYPRTEAHRLRHGRFLEDLGRLGRQLSVGIGTHEDFAILTGLWLLDHEHTFDRDLAEYSAALIRNYDLPVS